MDRYKAVVMDYLQADRAVFINSECRMHLDESEGSGLLPRRCSCDAVAIDLRHGAVYLCESAFEQKLQPLIKKIASWTQNWDLIKTALVRDYKVPPNWRVHVWLFVPRKSIEILDEKLEHVRRTIAPKFKVKITALEDVQPWRVASWRRREGTWETSERRMLT